jgi:SNF2 family DNA or RNA helicase
MDLPNYNNTNYTLAIRNNINSVKYDENSKLKYHQFVIKEFFTKNQNTRGILVCHGMGQGKTRLAVAISDYFEHEEPTRNIILLSFKSLANNFLKEVASFKNTTIDNPQLRQKYKFISLNSSNMYKQVANLGKDPEEIKMEQQFSQFMKQNSTNGALENSLLIVDEAHNLFNSITNGAQNAIGLYDLIMQTSNIKIVFLSGTPVINHPFELVACFNMLRGVIVDKYLEEDDSNFGDVNAIAKNKLTNKKHTYTTIFSEDIDEFENYFIDVEHNTIKNKDKFTNRIVGLVSYYGDVYFEDKMNKKGFPKELPTIVEMVHMSKYQFAAYYQARQTEIKEDKFTYRAKKSRFSSVKGSISTYRVKSRQASNYTMVENLEKLTKEELLNVAKYSPKIEKMLSNIATHHNQRGIIYSQFVTGYGINIVEKVLKSGGKIYAKLTGDCSPQDRADIISAFNDEESSIQLLLISGAVAEGIDLKGVRHVHILEPFWNYARINQVKARAIRYMSHEHLPEKERTVQTYIYLSTYPKKYSSKKIIEPTTDVDLYEKSIHNMKVIDTFMLALAESSIDCALHYPKLSDKMKKSISCKLCAPTNKYLFHPQIRVDMGLPNPCSKYIERKVKTEIVEIVDDQGKKVSFNYTRDPLVVYVFNKKLNGFSPMERSHPLYGKVVETITNI